eukprot:GHRQ01034203.1.p3 GENE.GHRQ01034203.1~~GHRQ01034203.1.p3  ORF type:complete len:130 (+),score=39.84 GHRQ01034203.1:250-639(+)
MGSVRVVVVSSMASYTLFTAAWPHDRNCCCCRAEAKVDAGLAARATGGAVRGCSRAMALRRLHWRNSLLGELLYMVNVAKVPTDVDDCNALDSRMHRAWSMMCMRGAACCVGGVQHAVLLVCSMPHSRV